MATEEAQPDSASIGAALRHIRSGSGLSGQAVADALGWSGSKVSLVEHGKQELRILEVAQYAQFFGYTLDEVWALATTLATFSSRLSTAPNGWYAPTLFDLHVDPSTPSDELISAVDAA